jgi:hypothetical protein
MYIDPNFFDPIVTMKNTTHAAPSNNMITWGSAVLDKSEKSLKRLSVVCKSLAQQLDL